MKIKLILILFLTFSVKSLFCQSIVNTEKLFTTSDEGLGISAELAGSSIRGNASVLLLEYALNFSYKHENHYLRLPNHIDNNNSHSWNQFVIRLQNNNYAVNKNYLELFETDFKKNNSLRNFLKSRLSENGINSIIYYPIPIHAQIAYKNFTLDRESLINTEKVCTEVLSLPMFPEITYEEQIYIINNLNLILNEKIKEAQISA